jgi:hypothetical protein
LIVVEEECIEAVESVLDSMEGVNRQRDVGGIYAVYLLNNQD